MPIMAQSTNLKAVLLDLDGVLYVGNEMIAGAEQAVARLRARAFTLAGVTNTTTTSRRSLAEKLHSLGIPLAEKELFTPAALAVQAIGGHSAELFIRDALREDFKQIKEKSEKPDFVVMGDPGDEGYPPEMLKEIFVRVMGGSRLLALHKNRFWQRPDGLHLDLGAFVAAIEYATGEEATVLGKPSKTFFHGICEALGVEPAETIMVGDDVEADIGGAQLAGLKTALVQTGKYREEFVKQIMRKKSIQPTVVIPSIAELPDALALF